MEISKLDWSYTVSNFDVPYPELLSTDSYCGQEYDELCDTFSRFVQDFNRYSDENHEARVFSVQTSAYLNGGMLLACEHYIGREMK